MFSHSTWCHANQFRDRLTFKCSKPTSIAFPSVQLTRIRHIDAVSMPHRLPRTPIEVCLKCRLAYKLSYCVASQLIREILAVLHEVAPLAAGDADAVGARELVRGAPGQSQVHPGMKLCSEGFVWNCFLSFLAWALIWDESYWKTVEIYHLRCWFFLPFGLENFVR